MTVMLYTHSTNDMGCVMVSILALSAEDLGVEPWSDQTKDYKFIFSASLLSTSL